MYPIVIYKFVKDTKYTFVIKFFEMRYIMSI